MLKHRTLAYIIKLVLYVTGTEHDISLKHNMSVKQNTIACLILFMDG